MGRLAMRRRAEVIQRRYRRLERLVWRRYRVRLRTEVNRFVHQYAVFGTVDWDKFPVPLPTDTVLRSDADFDGFERGLFDDGLPTGIHRYKSKDDLLMSLRRIIDE